LQRFNQSGKYNPERSFGIATSKVLARVSNPGAGTRYASSSAPANWSRTAPQTVSASADINASINASMNEPSIVQEPVQVGSRVDTGVGGHRSVLLRDGCERSLGGSRDAVAYPQRHVHRKPSTTLPGLTAWLAIIRPPRGHFDADDHDILWGKLYDLHLPNVGDNRGVMVTTGV
jgi:hypothetical protein